MKYTLPLVSLGLGIILLAIIPTTQGKVSAEDANAKTIIITRDTVENNDDETPVVLMSAKNVSSEEDLRDYALTALKADEKIDEMKFTDEDVSVSYPAHGRAFGLVPVVFMVNATVDIRGHISIRYPWYRFGVVADTGNIETNIRSEITDATKELTSSQNASSTSPIFMAEMASRVYSVLKRNYEVGSSSSTEPQTSDVSARF